MSNGKGSARRPCSVSEAELALNWELAFGGYRIDPNTPAVVSGFEWKTLGLNDSRKELPH